MKFNERTGRWEDKGKRPNDMKSSVYRTREMALAKECRRRWQALEDKRLASDLSAEELDQYAALAQAAFDALEAAQWPTQKREKAEEVGRNNRNKDRRCAAEDRRDEIRQVLRDRPDMSAGDVELALKRANLGSYPRSTIEKDLQKIRGRVK